MNYNEVKENAKKTIGTNCKVCPECNGLACGNTMPGPGSKAPGNGAHENWKAWKSYKLNMDTIAPNYPADTSFELFGKKFTLPVIPAPIGSIAAQFNPTDDVRDYNECCAAVCEKEGMACSFGDGLNESVFPHGCQVTKAHGGISIPVINPFSVETIKEKLDLVNEAMPFAVSLVIDSAGLPHLKAVNPNAGAKTVEELKEIKAYCKMPFIVKGVMTAQSALKAVEAGADAIVVSNHGGRVLAETPATADVLPEIVEAVGGKTKIIVDGGIRTGIDVFKAIALGADAVMICRPFLISYYGGKEEGIRAYIDKLRAEFTDAMYMCGARKVSDINKDMIRKV